MKNYALLLGAGVLLLLNSCNKERLEPAVLQINPERLFHEAVNDSTDIRDDWNKHRYDNGEEPPEEPGDES